MANWEASFSSSIIGRIRSPGLQLVSHVKFKVKAGSGGVVLGPIKYFFTGILSS